MKVRFLTIMVSALAVSSAPAMAAGKSHDLPLTPAFSAAVSEYRDCVLDSLDRVSPAQPRAMVTAAIAACGDKQAAVRSQLATDIHAARPDQSVQAAAVAAQNGVAQLNPIIAAVALDHARAMVGAASATQNLPLTRSGTIG